MITDEKLKELKELALAAKPFVNGEVSTGDETDRVKTNWEFMIMAHELLPEIINNLLSIRWASHR